MFVTTPVTASWITTRPQPANRPKPWFTVMGAERFTTPPVRSPVAPSMASRVLTVPVPPTASAGSVVVASAPREYTRPRWMFPVRYSYIRTGARSVRLNAMRTVAVSPL